MRRATTPIHSGFLIAGALLIAAYWIWWRPLLFDSDAWKSAAGDYTSSTRYRMRESAQKLIAQGVIKSQADALHYFGPSDADTDSNRWLYRLGPQFVPVDFWWLDLRFDEHGTVTAYNIRVD
jgi:hypothetical protein